MRAQQLAGWLLVLTLGGCIPLGEQDALRVEAEKEWQSVTTDDEVRGWWAGPAHRADEGLMLSCQSPASQERTITQNGLNDAAGYRQCPPLPPAPPVNGALAPLPQPWPPALVGQRLAPRS